jgi:OmpA-OmpF porin, OOP family
MASLLDEATSLLTPELLGKAAAAFGVPAEGIAKAMGAAMPTVLGAVANKASDAGFAGQLFQMVTNASNSGSPGSSAMDVIGAIAGGGGSPMLDIGKKLVGGLFGGSGDGIASAIGRMAGVSGAGSGILGTVGAMALSMLGNRVRSGGINASSLASMLMGEKASLMKAIPGPLSAMMGIGDIAGAGAAKAAATGAAVAAATKKSSSMLPALLGLAAIAAVAWWMVGRKPAAPAAPTPPVAEMPAAPAVTVPAGFEMLKLPNGTEIQVSSSGIEKGLVGFIQDASKPVDKTTWFDFDRLLYATGSAVLEPSSQDQLKNIAAIMAAFPNVTLKIGGYTDNVGKKAANMKLSGDRANAAMAELVKLGVAADRLAAEGYGDTVPVADNSTEEGRAKNRRTAARVSAK